MHRLERAKKIFALVLAVALLTLRMGAYTQEGFVEPIQNFISRTVLVTGEHSDQRLPFFKPKTSVADPVLFFRDTEILGEFHPSVSLLDPLPLFWRQVEVSSDIFIPPEIFA
jgi:hypothetical protein